MGPPPFVIFGMPRSRTFWLARYLTYGPWVCGHDETRHVRSLDDVRAWLSQPCTGTCETAAAPFWRTLRALRPDARVVVVRRPVADVVASLMALGLGFDAGVLGALMWRLDRKLDQVAARWQGTLSVTFGDLADEATCAAVFTHCTGLAHDHDWWAHLAPINLQIDMRAMVRYFAAHMPALNRVAAQIGQQTRAGMAARPVVTSAGMTIAAEPFRDFYRDGGALFRDHLVEVGEGPDDAATKNIPLLEALDDAGHLLCTTARCNGRMFGYLVTLISPTIEHLTRKSSVHTFFFADPNAPGLGMRLQRAALGELQRRGIGELVMRAGPRGSGPRMGTLYRRLGAVPDGEMYRLNIQGL